MSHSTPPDCEPNSTNRLPGTAGRAGSQEAPSPGALESLAECADPSRPYSKRHLHLLGLAGLSTQARSEYGKLLCGGGYWNLYMRPSARTASVQQSTRLDLQPHEPRSGHVGFGSASALVVRVLIHAEWHGVPFRAGHGRRLALLAAPPDGSV